MNISTIRRVVLSALVVVLLPGSVWAQTPSTSSGQAPTPAPPAPPAAPAPSRMSHLWIVIGPGFTTARAGCPSCDPEGVYAKATSLLLDAGVRVTPRIDAGLELLWAELKVDGGEPIRTTFILGV